MDRDGFMALRHMMDLQHELQEQLGVKTDEMTPTELMAYVREQMLACTDELHEALQETGWKTWAKNPHINEDAFRAELIDAWQFLMNLMHVGGMTPDMLVAGHGEKVRKNLERIAANYDGVSTKCPSCRRAYDDGAVGCNPAGTSDQGLKYAAWCARDEISPSVSELQIGTHPRQA